MSEEDNVIDVGMSEMKVAPNDHILKSVGIGSCVVITLYDPEKRIGAMAHPMLSENVSGDTETPLRFVESAIEAMLLAITGLGASKKRLEAKIIGGANMFKVFDKNPDSIGMRNTQVAKNKLEKEGIKIVANDTGGSVGRSVAFDINTGHVEVKTLI